MKYSVEQVARAYQTFCKMVNPYISIFDQSGDIRPPVRQTLQKVTTTLNAEKIDVVAYFTYLYEHSALPPVRQLCGKKLLDSYKSYKNIKEIKRCAMLKSSKPSVFETKP